MWHIPYSTQALSQNIENMVEITSIRLVLLHLSTGSGNTNINQSMSLLTWDSFYMKNGTGPGCDHATGWSQETGC